MSYFRNKTPLQAEDTAVQSIHWSIHWVHSLMISDEKQSTMLSRSELEVKDMNGWHKIILCKAHPSPASHMPVKTHHSVLTKFRFMGRVHFQCSNRITYQLNLRDGRGLTKQVGRQAGEARWIEENGIPKTLEKLSPTSTKTPKTPRNQSHKQTNKQKAMAGAPTTWQDDNNPTQTDEMARNTWQGVARAGWLTQGTRMTRRGGHKTKQGRQTKGTRGKKTSSKTESRQNSKMTFWHFVVITLRQSNSWSQRNVISCNCVSCFHSTCTHHVAYVLLSFMAWI